MSRSLGVFSCALLILAIASCDSTDPDGTPDFGVPYAILASLGDMPAIVGDTLHVSVGYSGGCEQHVFTVNDRPGDGRIEIWLHHDDKNDSCNRLRTDSLRLHLDKRITDATHIRLLDPAIAQFPDPPARQWFDLR